MGRLRIGAAGLGRAFTLMLPALSRHARVRLVAAADPRPEARRRFAEEFKGSAYETVEALCGDPDVDAVYVATPHQHHAAHAIAAAAAGKHVLVEKPMALSIEECAAMGKAARDHGVQLVVGHSHSFDAPVALARRLIDSGELGAVRMLTLLNFTDYLYRPRRPEELDSERGGGVFFSQAAHQVDIARLLAGAPARTARAFAGRWDASRPTDGAYSALLGFEGGVFASLTYSGYGHFDSDELCGWVSELGQEKDASRYGATRRALAAAADELAAKNARGYGGAGFSAAPAEAPWHEQFGLVVASCEKGDIRPMPRGVWVYGDQERRFVELAKPPVPRGEVLDELCDAVLGIREPLHDARWGAATLETCLAMLRSARTGAEVRVGGGP